MKKPVSGGSPAEEIDAQIAELGDWRGETLAKVRKVILAADAEIVEELKWGATPVWSREGILCTGETYKKAVKLTFAKGAALPDPSGLFNASLDGNVRRAIDIHEGVRVDEAALKKLVRAAIALNVESKSKSKSKTKTSAKKSKPQPTTSTRKAAKATKATKSKQRSGKSLDR